MKNICIAAMLVVACGAGIAKIPPPVLDDAAKAKAAEAAAKAAWQAKLDAFQLCRVQDRVAAFYRKSAGAAPAASAAHPAAAPAAAASPTAKVAANPAVPGGTAAAPAGAPTPTPCADPGAYASNAPSQTPLETSGAHSPAGTAVGPPSVRATSAEMAPAKK
jgi:hypothetical protein